MRPPLKFSLSRSCLHERKVVTVKGERERRADSMHVCVGVRAPAAYPLQSLSSNALIRSEASSPPYRHGPRPQYLQHGCVPSPSSDIDMVYTKSHGYKHSTPTITRKCDLIYCAQFLFASDENDAIRLERECDIVNSHN